MINNVDIENKIPLITLVGPPNSGKTTLFNYLSGKNVKTVNYPGATVEYSMSRMLDKFNIKANLIDNPGIVSLIPSSPDEQVSIESIYHHHDFGTPDLIVATVDASQLARHLLLVKQLLESGFNVVVALTMIDLLHKKGLDVSATRLKKELGCDVVKIDSKKGKGIDKLIGVINKNLDLSNESEKKQPVHFDKTLPFQKLIDSYKDIERIEESVTFDYNGNGKDNNIDLDEANRQLKVLNQPSIKQNKNKLDNTTLKIDRILLHRVWGLITFFLIMSATFTSIFWLADPLMNLVDELFGILAVGARDLLGATLIGDLVADGIISGTGSVLVFIPQIMILFLILGILEDTGYLSRGAMLIDKPLSKIGLNGRSFVPMISGYACAVPAIMAARTIPSKKERFLTIFILPLMSCSARLPVYSLLIAFLVPTDKLWIGGVGLAAIYIFSTFSSIVVAGIANKFKHKLVKDEEESSFIMELPTYRRPKFSTVISNTFNSTKMYVQKAGPIILVFSILIWMITYFPETNPDVDTTGLTDVEISQVKDSERLSSSYAADLGKFMTPVMEPIGMDWRVGVALITSIAAREVFVSTMALIFKVTSVEEENIQTSLLRSMRSARISGTGKKLFTPSTIIGLIVFFIFALQCLSTIAISRKETGSWKIPILQLIIFTSFAYLLTFITVNGLRALGLN